MFVLLFVYLHGLGVHSDYPRDLDTFRRPCVHNEGPTLERALVHSEVSQLTISTGLSQNQTYSQRTESAVNRQYYQTKMLEKFIATQLWGLRVRNPKLYCTEFVLLILGCFR